MASEVIRIKGFVDRSTKSKLAIETPCEPNSEGMEVAIALILSSTRIQFSAFRSVYSGKIENTAEY